MLDSKLHSWILWQKQRGYVWPFFAPANHQSVNSVVVNDARTPHWKVVFVLPAMIQSENHRIPPNEHDLLVKMIKAMGLELGITCQICYLCLPIGELNIPKRPPTIAEGGANSFSEVFGIKSDCFIILGEPLFRAIYPDIHSPFTNIRGLWLDREPLKGAKIMATWSPKDLVATPEKKRHTWNDLQKVMGELDL